MDSFPVIPDDSRHPFDEVHDPVDADDDLYGALAAHAGPWLIGDPDAGELLPVTRDQIAQARAWRRRVAEGG